MAPLFLFDFDSGTGGGRVVKNLAACAKLSLLTSGGNYWTYDFEEKLCWVKTSQSGRKAYSGHVSGNSACGNRGEREFFIDILTFHKNCFNFLSRCDV